MPRVPKGIIFKEFALNQIISKQMSVSRFPLHLLQLLAQKYNFRIQLKRGRDYGHSNKSTFRWNGMMGMLQRREIDILATSLLFSKERVDVGDSGFDLIKYRQFFIFRHPKNALKKGNVFLMPLNADVWCMVLGVSLCTIVTLVLLTKFETNTSGNRLSAVMLNIVGMLAQQGITADSCTSTKGRMVLIVFLLLSFVCFQFYSASIVGSLLAPPPRTITTVTKLMESNLKIVLQEHPGSHLIFRVASFSDVANLYERKVKGKEVYLNVGEGLSKVKDGNHALLVYIDDTIDTVKATLTHSEMEELQTIPLIPQDYRAHMYMFLQKDSPFSEAIRVGNIRLGEVGLKAYHLEKWTVKLIKRTNNFYGTAIVDLKRTSSIFYLLLIGHLISFAIFLGELIVFKKDIVKICS